MFPIRDHNPSGRTPYVVYSLILLNVLAYLAFTPDRDHGRESLAGLLVRWHQGVPVDRWPARFRTVWIWFIPIFPSGSLFQNPI